MPTATLSSKYQITIPMEIVRSLGLRPGEKIAIEQVEDRIVMLKEPASWADYFTGRLKGVYGSTVEEIDRDVAEVRASWESPVITADDLQDHLQQNEAVLAICRVLSDGKLHGYSELMTVTDSLRTNLDAVLDELKQRGAVHEMPLEFPSVIGEHTKYRQTALLKEVWRALNK
jgi:AbrB family looped-hinge helix DNA binding protein